MSISFPNYQLFSKFSWSDNESQPDYSGWIVLLLDGKVLWELDCAFCQENAASNTVRHIPLEERKKPDALKGMFVDVCCDTNETIYQRQSLQIPDHYPNASANRSPRFLIEFKQIILRKSIFMMRPF